jgi:large repetitive protein
MLDPVFAPAVNNPFGLTDIGGFNHPTFIDIDGDGKFDALIGNSYGNTLFFKNTGTTTAPAFAAAIINPFGLIDVGYSSGPTFVDINGDGKLDAFVGNRDGNTLFFKNTGTTTAPAFAAAIINPFDLIDVGYSSNPTFVDIDGDGKPDAFVGNRDGNTLFFKNTGTTTGPAFAPALTNPFGLANIGVSSRPTFVDIDGDGKLDAFVGNVGGNTLFFRNTGTTTAAAFAPAVTNPFGLIDVGTFSSPTLVDINGDSKLDAFVGDKYGNTLFFKNISPPSISAVRYDLNASSLVVTGTGFLTLIGANNDIDVSKLTITGEGVVSYTLTSGNVDLTTSNSFTVKLNPADKAAVNAIINNKGRQSNGGTTYNLAAAQYWAAGAAVTVVDADLKNGITAVAEPIFAVATANPFGLNNVGTYSTPTFVDINADGKLDAFVGNVNGNTIFFKNTGTNIAPAFAAALTNPFGLFSVGLDSIPTFADIDGNGTLDAFVGNSTGNTLFFRNTGTNIAPAFAPALANPFGLANIGNFASPTFADIDDNGTLDAFIGTKEGNILFFKNTGTLNAPAFAPAFTNPFGLTDVGDSSKLTFVDIDGDGVLDVLVGRTDGNTLFFRNTGTTTSPEFTPAVVNPFALTDVGTSSKLTFVDINGDSNLDAFAGNGDGNTLFFKNTLPPVTTTTTTRNDFNSDGKSDILWRSTTGTIALWQMNGSTVVNGDLTSISNLDNSWKVNGTGDFNGDRKSDILWRNDNGSIALWQMNGSTVVNSSLTSIPALDNSWKIAGTGDFNGDKKSDILWRNDNGAIAVWKMNGSTVVNSSLTSIPSLDNSWKINGTGDFNGDGKSDILWRNDDGSVALWQMNGFNVLSSSLTSTPRLDGSWKINGTGDFNGDGKSDILWRNDNGSIALWQMNGSSVVASSLTSTPSLDSSWKITGTSDFDGDGKADILWRNDSGAVAVWQMNGATVLSSSLTSIQPDHTTWKIAAPIL